MKKTALRTAPWVLLAACFAGYVLLMNGNIDKLVDSDMATEMVYAKLLHDEGALLSQNWLFSTEIRVLWGQLFFVPLFSLTDSWHAVRVAGSALMMLSLLAAMWYLCRRLMLRKVYPYVGMLLLTPFSMEYFNIILRGQYYTVYLAASVLMLAMMVHYMQTKGSGALLLLLIAVLAVLMGMSGLRLMLTFCLPALLTAFALYLLSLYHQGLPKEQARRFLRTGVLCFACAAVGVVIYVKGIMPNYSIGGGKNALFIGGMAETRFTGFSLKRLEELFNQWLELLGWQIGRLFSWTLVGNLLAGCLAVLLVMNLTRCLRRNTDVPAEHTQLALLYGMAATVFLLFHVFTNQLMATRYQIPVFVFLLPLLLAWFENGSKLKWLNRLMAAGLAALVAVNGAHIYRQRVCEEDWNAQYREMAQVLQDNGCSNAYATFWYPGNVLTEMSNGQITTRIWNPVVEDVEDFYLIGQEVRLTQTPPKGPVCLIFFDGDNVEHPLRERLSANDILWQNENYSVYAYDSYQALKDGLTHP